MPSLKKLLGDSHHPIKHVLRAQDFNRDMLMELFAIADALEKKPSNIMRGRTLYWYGDEASSRTAVSFIKAAQDLGGTYIARTVAESSEGGKGESLEDTIVTLSTIDPEGVIALRHPDEDAIYRAALVSRVPVINAGSGGEQHPTQADLDTLTIFKTLGRLEDFSIAFVGDIKYARTINSLAYRLTKFRNITVYLVSRDNMRMKGDLRYYLELHREKMNIEVIETSDLEWVIGKVDIVYQTRAQKERPKTEGERLALAANTPFIIDRKMASKMKTGAKIMHPWPRQEELAREVDYLPQQLYIDQMHYGRIIRRALLAKICHDNPSPT